MNPQNGVYPLFKGATRLPTYGGIPRNVMLLNLMIGGTLFMTLHFYAIAIFLILWIICYAITKHDDRMFRIIWLVMKTKWASRSVFTKKWGGYSCSPTDYSGNE